MLNLRNLNQLSSPLVISRELTLNGNGSVLEADPNADWATDQSDLISVEAESTISIWLNNLTVQKSKGAGICAKTAQKVYLNNVTLKDNETAGLIVLAAVNAEGLHTSGNKWGGVYLDKSESTTEDGKFRFYTGCTYEEDLQIWAYSGQEHIESSFAVFCPDNGERWYDYNFRNEEDRYIWLWTNTKRNVKVSQETIDGFTYVYANGYSAKVTQSEDDASKVVIQVDYSETVESEGEKTILFGGCKDYPASHSYISIEGGKIHTVYGGGWGQTLEKSADVESVHINMNGGEVSHLMIGGGKGYARSEKLEVRIDNGDGVIHEFYPGGDAEGISGNTLSTPLDDAYNSVKEVNIRIYSGTIRNAMGLGGGLGLTRTGTSDIEVTDITLGGIYGASANGHADKINALFRNCKFEGGAQTIATLNKGMIDEITMHLQSNQYAENFQVYVGAAPGWGNSYTAGEPAPEVTGSVSYNFYGDNLPPVRVGEGLANANVSFGDAPILIGKFFRGSALPEGEQYIDVFEIGADKQWALNKNARFDMENPASLDIKGSLDNMWPEWYYNLVTTSTSLLVIPDKNRTMAGFVSDFNWANDGHPIDLSDKSLVFECTDGAIVSNKSLAKQWMAKGENVQLLQYNADAEQRKHYSLVYVDPNETLRITNLPDSVAYGTKPIELAFNQKGVKATITAGDEFAKIENGVLTILKPGEVTITLTDEADEIATSKLKITKRILTLTSGLTAIEKVYDGTTAIELTKGEYAFTGLVGEETVSFTSDPTGELTDANAGENKLVTVTAELAAGCADYYELAPITFVTANVTPKPITITAEAKIVKYGEAIDYTANDYSSSLVSDDKLDGTLKFSCAVPTDTLAGKYEGAITPYGLSSPNYAITYESGDLTIQAWGPSIRIIDHKIVKEGATTNIVMNAQLINNGGAEIDKVTFTYKQDNVETPVTDMTEKDGIYTVTYKNMPAGNYELWITAHNNAGHSGAAFIKVTVDEKTPQNLTWDKSVLSTMVYGQEMTLSATSDQAVATGTYSYSVSPWYGAAEFVRGTVIKATKVGAFTIGVSRSGDENYSPATLETIINVVQKPITVEVGEISKIYDGTTTIATPTFTLSGVETGDDVSINTENLALSFASKNAGDNIAVILPELTLTGDDAGNYTLVQPTNVTGTIAKAPLTIKVKDVTRPWNQRYTKYEFETSGLVNNETLAQAYTGTLKVAENGNTLGLTADSESQNYTISTENGTLTIEKGTPKAVVYGSDNAGWHGMIVDYQGYNTSDLVLDENEISRSGKALVKNGEQEWTSINSKPTATQAASLNAASFSLRSASLRGTVSPGWNNASFTSVVYGSEAMAFSVETGFTYTSTNMSVLTVTANTSTVTVTPVGVGNATIIAESAGEVKIWNVTVTPKELGLTTTGMEKTYDGTATATGKVSLGTGVVGTDDVALDLGGITFNYDNKNVSENKSVTPSQPLVLIGTNANNYALSSNLTGKITQKVITINNPITVYYNGQTVHALTTYPVSGLVAGDVVPIKVTFADAAVGAQTITSIALATDNDALNYTLSSTEDGMRTGTIQRSTLVATLPSEASSVSNLKSNIQLVIRETGEAVTANTVSYEPTITTTGSGANTVYYVTGGDTDNYTVVYTTNQVGYGAEPENPGGGTVIEPDPITPIVSDPVIAERTATTAAITWEKVAGATSYKLFLYAKKGDSTPLNAYEFDKNGNLKATNISFTLTELEEGKAYYVETAAYNASGTLLVKKGVELSATPTGIESIAEGSLLYAVKGAIVIVPTAPIEVMIVSANGRPIFHDEVAGYTQITAKAGIYVVVIQKGKDRLIEKVIVK